MAVTRSSLVHRIVPRVLAAATAVLLTVEATWLVASPDAPEGKILWVVSNDHGLCAGDVGAIAMALTALALWFGVVFAPTTQEERTPLPLPADPHFSAPYRMSLMQYGTENGGG